MAKPLTGSLKRNDKQGVETRPDYRGKITLLDGQEFWLSGWMNADRETGEKYMSLKLQPKEDKPQYMNTPAPSPAPVAASEAEEDDDLPF
jgi:uncharacterized protein (DUF736 family)